MDCKDLIERDPYVLVGQAIDVLDCAITSDSAIYGNVFREAAAIGASRFMESFRDALWTLADADGKTPDEKAERADACSLALGQAIGMVTMLIGDPEGEMLGESLECASLRVTRTLLMLAKIEVSAILDRAQAGQSATVAQHSITEIADNTRKRSRAGKAVPA